jgi:dTDP-4-dehydrorhamnose reductase
MKILFLGSSGMVGHQLVEHFKNDFEVVAAYRSPKSFYSNRIDFSGFRQKFEINCLDSGLVEKLIIEERPDALINCAGIVKQSQEIKSIRSSIEINSVLPHRLNETCEKTGTRLIHLSTDCVFSGRKGMYSESDEADATDTYGRTKYLGEIRDSRALTIRTSKIGTEVFATNGLVEWFLSQKGKIKGFKKSIFSGFTMTEFGRILEKVLTQHRDLKGVYHIASQPINKFDLLAGLQELIKKWDVQIEPDESFLCDRSLNGTRFNETTGYKAPPWSFMLEELAKNILSKSKRGEVK